MGERRRCGGGGRQKREKRADDARDVHVGLVRVAAQGETSYFDDQRHGLVVADAAAAALVGGNGRYLSEFICKELNAPLLLHRRHGWRRRHGEMEKILS